MKTLSTVNYSHKMTGLTRYKFISAGQYTALSSVVSNFRRYIHDLGYDCSLLNDSEVMGFEDEVHLAEQDGDNSSIINILEFLSK